MCCGWTGDVCGASWPGRGGGVPGGDEGPPEPFRGQLARGGGFPGAGVGVPERLERLMPELVGEVGGDGLQGDGGLHEFARFLCLLQCSRRRGREGFVEPRLNADRGEVHTGVALGDGGGVVGGAGEVMQHPHLAVHTEGLVAGGDSHHRGVVVLDAGVGDGGHAGVVLERLDRGAVWFPVRRRGLGVLPDYPVAGGGGLAGHHRGAALAAELRLGLVHALALGARHLRLLGHVRCGGLLLRGGGLVHGVGIRVGVVVVPVVVVQLRGAVLRDSGGRGDLGGRALGGIHVVGLLRVVLIQWVSHTKLLSAPCDQLPCRTHIPVTGTGESGGVSEILGVLNRVGQVG